jgi:hypothetical protein
MEILPARQRMSFPDKQNKKQTRDDGCGEAISKE